MTATTPPSARSPRSPSRLARGVILAASTLTLMAAAIIAPGLPAMREEFAGSPGADLLVRFVLTITSLAIALSAPASGLVADRLGRRTLLVSSLVLYAFSGTGGFFAGDLYTLLGTRALLGVAVGGIMTAVSATLTDWFDGPRRASFLGLQQAFASLGGVVFLPLGGLLATVDWRAPFWLYAVSAAVAVFAVVALRDEPRLEHGTALDQPRPSQPGGMRRIAGVYVVALAATLVFYMAPTQLPFLLGDFGSGPTVVGAVIAGSTLSGTAGALAFPALRRRWSTTSITTLGVGLLGAGWLLVGTADTVEQVLAGMLVGGVGVGLVVPNLNLRLSELARPAQRGRVLSGLVTGIFLGQFLSPLAVQPLVRTTSLADAFTWTGIALTVGAALIAVVALATAGPTPPPRKQNSREEVPR
ncbi:MFS transporter [Streptomyces sp. NPDC088747]|uniref:MFS transporter n=1 Tax=Streptomyces sp. NPDC088747 TaxID=3365886 RepID=UPI0038048911